MRHNTARSNRSWSLNGSWLFSTHVDWWGVLQLTCRAEGGDLAMRKEHVWKQ